MPCTILEDGTDFQYYTCGLNLVRVYLVFKNVTKKTSISVSIVLLAAFAVFNAGMPVYFYLCPMMSDDVPLCNLSPASADGLSLTSITPDCCAKIFVAERKTTPFLKTADGIPDLDRICIATINASSALEPSRLPVSVNSVSSIPESPPLFLLHSALLI